ncbi:hypothetical protein [Neogemmobacter tilapiae]|uniref:COG3904 family protein n=1 Tax=Neogemmobacter tilapiae TaxID=875041 RepID=UPI001672A605|nr:hypothetical protein [Gemmobacter tilapiae]
MALLLAILLPQTVQAELVTKYDPVIYDPEVPEIVAIVGTIDARTPLNFSRALEEMPRATEVILASDGGSVLPALTIAREIDRLKLNTTILPDTGCYSACAFLFFAGNERASSGELGVHQISSDSGDLESGQLALSDMMDVLSDYNVPDDVIVDMLRTPPEEMHIYTPEQLATLGIIGTSSSRVAKPTTPTADMSKKDLAAAFVQDFNRLWSLPNAQAVDTLAEKYALTVNYYGKSLTNFAVIEDKRAFAERWPLREYLIEPGSTAINCDELTCRVETIVAWQTSAPERGARSRGRALQSLTLVWNGSGFRISVEDGTVLERQ